MLIANLPLLRVLSGVTKVSNHSYFYFFGSERTTSIQSPLFYL